MAAAPKPRPRQLPDAHRAEAVSQLRLLIADSGTAPPEPHRPPADAPPIQVPPPLRRLLRGGEIQRGSVVALRGSVNYLALAVAAGASAAGAWCGVVGMPDFGIAAASGLGADLRRFLMLDDPGEREADAVAVMADACDLILWNPARRLTLAEDRRIRTRIRPAERRRGAALVVLRPDARAEADLRLSTSDPQWTGLGQGSGHLTGRLVTVTASGRGAAGYEPSTRLWLPAGNGAISEAEAEPAKNAGEPPRHLRPA